MNHLAKIHQDFIRLARKWQDLTREQQEGYLSRHPATRRRLTVGPTPKAPVSGLKIHDPQRSQSRAILDLMRSGTNALSDTPEWRNYLTKRSEDGGTNKYHYFAVMLDKNKMFAAANVWGRIGYPPKGIKVLGTYSSKKEALDAAQHKLDKKMIKGYTPTPL